MNTMIPGIYDASMYDDYDEDDDIPQKLLQKKLNTVLPSISLASVYEEYDDVVPQVSRTEEFSDTKSFYSLVCVFC